MMKETNINIYSKKYYHLGRDGMKNLLKLIKLAKTIYTI